MAAVEAGLIAGGVSLTGDLISAMGQANTNAESIQVANANNQFNSAQAALNRQFQAEQSATAMQTRVADDKAAGLNPALAYQQGGATAMQGSVADANPNPNLQNPAGSFSQLGAQASSAIQAADNAADVSLKQAQANKANVESGTLIPAQVGNLDASAGLNETQMAMVQRNIYMANLALGTKDPSAVGQGSPYQQQLQANAAGAALKNTLMTQDATIQQATMNALIELRNSEAKADSVNADNIRNASDGAWGQMLAYFSIARPAVSSAQAVGGALGNAAEMIGP